MGALGEGLSVSGRTRVEGNSRIRPDKNVSAKASPQKQEVLNEEMKRK